MSEYIVFTNFIPPYRKPFYEKISALLNDRVTFYLSTSIESNRKWEVDWGQLNVRVQKSLKFKYTWRQKDKFTETAFVHVPVDTLAILFSVKPRAVVSSELGFRTMFCCIYKLFYPRTKLIIWATLSEQSEVGRGWLRHILRKSILRFATLIYTNGQSGINYIKSVANLRDEQFVRIPYTVDHKLFEHPVKRGWARSGTLTFLYVGHVSTRKGITTAIEILKKWCVTNPAAQVHLSMVGQIELTNLTALLKTLPGNLAVSVHNHIAYQELKSYYIASDFLLFPTLADEWGVVVNESLLAGVPVIGSIHSQAVLELVKESWNGWKIDIAEEHTLLSAFDKAGSLSEEDLMNMRSNACKSLEGFDINNVAERFCAHL